MSNGAMKILLMLGDFKDHKQLPDHNVQVHFDDCDDLIDYISELVFVNETDEVDICLGRNIYKNCFWDNCGSYGEFVTQSYVIESLQECGFNGNIFTIAQLEKFMSWCDDCGFARYKGELYPFVRIIDGSIFLQKIKGRGLDTIVVNISEVEIIKYPSGCKSIAW